MNIKNELIKDRLFDYKELDPGDSKPTFEHIKQLHCSPCRCSNIFRSSISCSVPRATSSKIFSKFLSIYSIVKMGQRSRNFHEVRKIALFGHATTFSLQKSTKHIPTASKLLSQGYNGKSGLNRTREIRS